MGLNTQNHLQALQSCSVFIHILIALLKGWSYFQTLKDIVTYYITAVHCSVSSQVNSPVNTVVDAALGALSERYSS